MIADRCLRTVFNAWMSAPARSSRAVVCRLSASVTPSAGTAISAEAPPDSSTSERLVRRERRSERQRAPAGRLARVGRHRMAATRRTSKPDGTPVQSRPMTSPWRSRPPSRRAAVAAHDRRGLARRYQAQRAVGQRAGHGQRAREEAVGRAGSKTGPDDGQEVVSKIGE